MYHTPNTSTYTETCFVQNKNLQISFKKKRTFAWSFSQFCELLASTVYFTCYFILLSKSKAGYMKILEEKWARQTSFGILPPILLTSA